MSGNLTLAEVKKKIEEEINSWTIVRIVLDLNKCNLNTKLKTIYIFVAISLWILLVLAFKNLK